MYERAGYGLQCPDEIKAVLALLPKIWKLCIAKTFLFYCLGDFTFSKR
jgi:hypothetical protein